MGITTIFPRAAPVSHCLCLCKITAKAICFFAALLLVSMLGISRSVKGKTHLQFKLPASSSEESPGLGITCVLCPGKEHLFLKTGATSIVQQPSQVMLPRFFPAALLTSSVPNSSATHTSPSKNKFLSGSSLKNHWLLGFPWPLGHKQGSKSKIHPAYLKASNSSCIQLVCKFSSSLCYLPWFLLFIKYSHVFPSLIVFG